MSFSIGPSGGIRDPHILQLLAKLTILIKRNKQQGGASASEVVNFIEQHKDVTFVDQHSQHMHSFKELADAMAPLIQGIKITPKELPGDSWSEIKKDPKEPADWWKN